MIFTTFHRTTRSKRIEKKVESISTHSDLGGFWLVSAWLSALWRCGGGFGKNGASSGV